MLQVTARTSVMAYRIDRIICRDDVCVRIIQWGYILPDLHYATTEGWPCVDRAIWIYTYFSRQDKGGEPSYSSMCLVFCSIFTVNGSKQGTPVKLSVPVIHDLPYVRCQRHTLQGYEYANHIFIACSYSGVYPGSSNRVQSRPLRTIVRGCHCQVW